jgi:Txe/YoeB family toxin of Txe-Axe toxin-antitoxin module
MNDLSVVYRPKVRRPKNVFNIADKCADKIQEAEKISFEKVRQLIRKVKNDNWNGFLLRLNDLR